jgi:hypothetical protein
LPVAVAFNRHPDDNPGVNISVEVQFLDYRPVNGVQVPFHIGKLLQGTLTLDLSVTSVAVNSGVSPSTFAVNAFAVGGAQ